ncbi:YggT family protein [Sporolactobacillus kofuensis]|uniref:YggT family protein n=1 Tax=Sporolactobacillus kofuensis TaxID=269672 RepID=A0ABW1WAI2_9BACL|nr:YggT family protein [Sporolactobacillus kofuensis]MCO7174629.1 YggT family protein [Sporolactobacillus kofuensis]
MVIAYYLAQIIQVYSWILIIYILMSWLPSLQASSIGQLFARVCEPFLSPFRRIIPPIGGVIDLSPIVAFFVLQLATRGIYYIAYLFA